MTGDPDPVVGVSTSLTLFRTASMLVAPLSARTDGAVVLDSSDKVVRSSQS